MRMQNPDRLVFDLDPGPGVGLAECAEVARAVRKRLSGAVVPVTSGSKGIHLYSRLDGTLTSDDASLFAKEIAEAIEQDMPDLVVSRMAKVLRARKVFIDWSQNNGSKTTIAPYSLRGRDHPTVAAPRTWEELADPELASSAVHRGAGTARRGAGSHAGPGIRRQRRRRASRRAVDARRADPIRQPTRPAAGCH